MERTAVIRNILSPFDVSNMAREYKYAPVVWEDPRADWVKREATNLVFYAALMADRNNLNRTGDNALYRWANPYGAFLLDNKFTSYLDTYRFDEVDGQPYENADEMRAFLDKRGYLKISRNFNNPAWWNKSTNLLFRYAHDTHHCWTGDCNFELDGEVCAFTKFAAEIPFYLFRSHGIVTFPSQEIINALYGLLWGEIVGQVCYLREFGDFPDQKQVMYNGVGRLNQIRWVLNRYGVRHLLG